MTITHCKKAAKTGKTCQTPGKEFITRDEFCDAICQQVWTKYPDADDMEQEDARLAYEMVLRVCI